MKKLTAKEHTNMLELSKANDKLKYFTSKGINYWITGTSTTHNSCQIKNLMTNEYIRMETTDGSLGDVRLFPLDKINKYFD